MLDFAPLLHIVVSTVGAVGGMNMAGGSGMVAAFFGAFVGSYVLQLLFSGVNAAIKGQKFTFPDMTLSVIAGVGGVMAIEFFTGTNVYAVIGLTELLYLVIMGGGNSATYLYY